MMSTLTNTTNKAAFDERLIAEIVTLRAMARQFVTNKEDVNDLVQDTLMRAEIYWTRFRPGSNLPGWLYVIMKNTFINRYRRQEVSRGFIRQTEAADSEITRNEVLTDNDGEASFVAKDLQLAISGLPAKLHEPFCLLCAGYHYHEISDLVHIPIGTVKTRIHCARKQLKAALSCYRYRTVA